MKEDGGWTKQYRRRWKHPVFRNFRDAGIWSYLIDNAAWQDNTDTRFQGRRMMLMRGQIIVSERFLAEGFCCDRQVVRRLFDALEKDLMITRQKTHADTIITICNYGEYQGFDEDEKPTGETKQTQREPSANPNIEEDNNTDVDVSRERLREVGDRVLKLVRADEDPSCRLNASLVQVWLKRGFDPELDIYPTVSTIMTRAQGPPGSLKYFDRAIAKAFADRTRTIPDEAPNVHGSSSGKPAKPSFDDDLRTIAKVFNQPTGGMDTGLRDAEGPIIENAEPGDFGSRGAAYARH